MLLIVSGGGGGGAYTAPSKKEDGSSIEEQLTRAEPVHRPQGREQRVKKHMRKTNLGLFVGVASTLIFLAIFIVAEGFTISLGLSTIGIVVGYGYAIFHTQKGM